MDYQTRNHAPEANGVLVNRIKSLIGELKSPDEVARVLMEDDGCELECDGSGYVVVIKGSERCHYPLGITSMQ